MKEGLVHFGCFIKAPAPGEPRRWPHNMSMELKYRKESPDNKLILLVYSDGEDWIIGFDASDWHTHGDLLVPEYGSTPKEAVLAFMNEITDDKVIISISEVPNMPVLIRIVDNPVEDMKYKLPDEKLTIRYWSGKECGSQPGASPGAKGLSTPGAR